jgi:transcription antitermination factor NusG
MTKTAAMARDDSAWAKMDGAAVAEPVDDRKLWYVVRTNIKCEKRALAALAAAGYEAYLPLMRRDVVHHRTKKVVTKEFVLFNRYLFVAQPASGADWFRLRRCDGVEAVLGSGGRYFPVDARSVEKFRRAEAELEFDETRAAKLRRKEIGRTMKATAEMKFPAGTDIRVKKGVAHAHPFGGFFGKVESVRGRGVVTAMIELFGRLTPVEFQADEIERVR